jgi:hypothetical protein
MAVKLSALRTDSALLHRNVIFLFLVLRPEGLDKLKIPAAQGLRVYSASNRNATRNKKK